MQNAVALLLALVAFATVGGCAPMQLGADAGTGRSPLEAPHLAPDSVVLDLVTARFPLGDTAINGPLWDRIDEQQIPLDVRRRLQAHGLRAGVVGGNLPLELERVLDLQTRRRPAGEEPGTPQLDSEPLVRARQLRVRSGKLNQIIVTGETTRHAELSIIGRDDDGRITGRTYRRAMGLFAARAYPQADKQVRLEIVPELEHGEAEKRFVASDGALKVEFGPPHEVFEALRFNVMLAPGEMLVMTHRPESPGSLGHHFFTEEVSGSKMQKLLVIRLSLTQRDDRFDDDPLADVAQ